MTKEIFLFWLCFLISGSLSGQVEICDNAIDDDGDGLIDLNDRDCYCKKIDPVSLIENPSFEELECCPDFFSDLHCASGWIQASEPTTDLLHTCGWLGFVRFPPPRPFPDGEGVMGFRDGRNQGGDPNWKEYAGTCLLGPLLSDSVYRFEFDLGFVDTIKSPAINITFYGTSNCMNLPFGVGDESFGCPTNDSNWVKLGEVRVSGEVGGSWEEVTIELTPQDDIYAIAIGPDCDPSPTSTYYFFDDLQLLTPGEFDFIISDTLQPCNPNFALSVPFNSEYRYQWYLSGVALIGETTAKLSRLYGEGSYQLRIIDGSTCFVSAAYDYIIPKFELQMFETICNGDSVEFSGLEITEPGFYSDTLKTQNNCDSVITLELEVIGQDYDTITATIFEGETFRIGEYSLKEQGEYPLVFSSSLGCDSLVLLQLDVFSVFVPNVFSPNSDGVNDIFRPFAKSGVIQSVELEIFDRWGGRIHKGTEWNGNDAQTGVYVYLIKIVSQEGDVKVYSGDVTLLL